jgi:MFS family permease
VVKPLERTDAPVPDVEAAQRHTLRTLVVAQIIGGVGIGSALSVGAVLALELSGSQSWAGMATTMTTLGAAVCALPLARMAARRGRRVSLGFGWALASVGGLVVIAAAAARMFPLMLFGMALFGSGSATNLQSRFTATDLARPDKRARDLSMVVWATTIGSVLGPNLNEPGAVVAHVLGIPVLAGPFAISTAAFVLSGLFMWWRLRPDPLLTAQRVRNAAGAGTTGPPPLRAAFDAIRRSRGATLALVTVALSHAIMVSVMAMTPVHMKGHGATLTIVGLTISVHIAGMYALSPLVGWLSDRLGRITIILVGQGIMVVAVITAGTAAMSDTQVAVGMILIGLGWSCGTVSGATLLAESVDPADRPGAQGFSDLLMNLMGAVGGGLSGVILGVIGFPGLNAVAGLLVIPVIALSVRRLTTRTA